MNGDFYVIREIHNLLLRFRNFIIGILSLDRTSSGMCDTDKIDEIYKAIGEFVIVFQSVENLYRQIGWFILDPGKVNWPPQALRTENTRELIDKVTDYYADLTKKYDLPGGREKSQEMFELRDRFRELRRYRNSLLHSTFIELKTMDETIGYIRSDPKIGIDSDTGEFINNLSKISADIIHDKILEFADCIFRLGINYKQLIHWHPFNECSK